MTLLDVESIASSEMDELYILNNSQCCRKSLIRMGIGY